MSVSLSFRQISGFKYTSHKSEISFNFYGLTTENFIERYEIFLRLFLILGDGTIDTNPIEVKCILNEPVTLEGEQAQDDFECNITGLNEAQEYKSFKLYDSENIAGIPEKLKKLSKMELYLTIHSKKIKISSQYILTLKQFC